MHCNIGFYSCWDACILAWYIRLFGDYMAHIHVQYIERNVDSQSRVLNHVVGLSACYCLCLCQSVRLSVCLYICLATYIEGILPKILYLLCVSMAGRALLAGYPRYVIFICLVTLHGVLELVQYFSRNGSSPVRHQTILKPVLTCDSFHRNQAWSLA